METHIKAIGLLNILIGSLGGLFSVVAFVLSGTSLVSDDFPLRGFVIAGIMIAMAVLAVPMIVVGIGLLQFRRWARQAGTVLAIFTFLHFPVGTILAIYELSILLSADADIFFNPRFNSLHVRKP